MKKIKLTKLTFDEAVEIFKQETNTLTDIDALKDFAINNINDENYFLAIHILEAIRNSTAYYFDYDYSMGTLDNPTPLETIEDLEGYCED